MSITPIINNNNISLILILVCKEGYLDIVKILVEIYKANVNGPDENGITSLMMASRYGHFEIVAFLIENGADVNAISKKNIPYKVDWDTEKMTALILASKYNHQKIAQLLIENDANIDAIGWNGTALVYAIEYNRTEIAKLLIEKGEKINVPEYYKSRMMNGACACGYLEIVELLFAKGVDINCVCDYTLTPLIRASRYGHLEVVQFLVEKGANVNAAMNDGRTALMWASICGRLEIFEFLVKNGANINATTTNLSFLGPTALTYARQFHEDSIINENRLKIVKFITDREKKTVTNNFWDCIKRNMPFSSYTRIPKDE